jgi:hypothetical protein
MQIKPGEAILLASGRPVRVVAVVAVEEEDESPVVGMLKVEAV